MLPLWAFGAVLAALFGWGLYEASKREDDVSEPSEPLGPREYRIYLCGQGAGKTYQLKQAAETLAARGVTVHVCDHGAEYEDIGTVFKSFAEYESWTAEHGVPPVCVHQLGQDVERYEYVFNEAIDECSPDSDRTTAVLIDEAYEFAPSGPSWRGSQTLRRIVLAGRHLRNVEGETGCVHLLLATQYPYTLQLSVWQQANAVAVGHASGERFFSWVRANYGKEAEIRAKELGDRDWTWVLGSPTAMRTESGQGKRDKASRWFKDIRPAF